MKFQRDRPDLQSLNYESAIFALFHSTLLPDLVIMHPIASICCIPINKPHTHGTIILFNYNVTSVEENVIAKFEIDFIDNLQLQAYAVLKIQFLDFEDFIETVQYSQRIFQNSKSYIAKKL
jgi:hypothetical protein